MAPGHSSGFDLFMPMNGLAIRSLQSFFTFAALYLAGALSTFAPPAKFFIWYIYIWLVFAGTSWY